MDAASPAAAARVAGYGPRPAPPAPPFAPAARMRPRGGVFPSRGRTEPLRKKEPNMTELRSVDPATLIPNPNNPRRTPVPKAMDDQLIASIRTIGIIQPPVVREVDGGLVIKAGHRRVE